jgi:hypothetical protein
MSGPAVLIVLVLEERPSVRIDALSEGDALRMSDWLAAHPRYADLVERAIELAEPEGAA